MKFHHLFRQNHFLKHLPIPDLILGAGHSTHLSVILAGLKFKAHTAIIMKPSLPLMLFDSIICPKHDQLKENPKVFNTFGSLNKIDKTCIKDKAADRPLNLMLIGGHSKHFHFDTVELLHQVKAICANNPEEKWLLTNSPRTPMDTTLALKQLNLENLCVHDYQQAMKIPLQELLLKARFTWITPDSMSMIFEALTAETNVGLLTATPKKATRIVKQVQELIALHYVSVFDSLDELSVTDKTIPWEADRAAIWLLKRINLEDKEYIND